MSPLDGTWEQHLPLKDAHKRRFPRIAAERGTHSEISVSEVRARFAGRLMAVCLTTVIYFDLDICCISPLLLVCNSLCAGRETIT